MKKEFDFFEELEIKKANLSMIIGGTSTTSFIEVGAYENEYEDCNGDGDLSEEEMKGQKPILVEFPDSWGC